MSQRQTRFAAAVALITASSAATLILLEISLRLSQDPSDLFSAIITNPERYQKHNEARFWQRYADQPDAGFISFDPILGWDHDQHGSGECECDEVGHDATRRTPRIAEKGL